VDYKKDYSPLTHLTLTTNGTGNKVKQIIEKIPDVICIENTMKETNKIQFESFNTAPIDLEEYKSKDIKYSKGCKVNINCGFGLTRYGYYACGSGGSIDRVFGFNIGIKSYTELTEEKLREQLDQLCRYCGHFKADLYKDNYVSPTWQQAYEKYSEEKPELSLYGK
jgi:hypothetical protein